MDYKGLVNVLSLLLVVVDSSLPPVYQRYLLLINSLSPFCQRQAIVHVHVIYQLIL